MGPLRSRRLPGTGIIAALALALFASPAAGAATIGQTGPPLAGPCESGFDLLQESVTEGNAYVVPGTGRITQWATYGAPAPGSLTLKVLRLIAPPATYQVVGRSGPHAVTGTGTAGNTFPTDIRVQPGDVLGVNGNSRCILSASGGQRLQYMGDLAVGASAPFTNPAAGRLNVEATFVPDNIFALAQTTRNKKKGTATLTFSLPNAGQLIGAGQGVKVTATSPSPSGSVTVPGAGPTQLLVKAKGKKLAKLNRRGKVKLGLTVTYIPTGGDPSTQSLKVKLKKRLSR